MKYVKRFAIAAAALGVMVMAPTPADAATSSTTLAISGTLNADSGGASLLATCAGATASTDPGATNAGVCILSASGSRSGIIEGAPPLANCEAWGGFVSGSIVPLLNVLPNAPRYNISMNLLTVGRTLSISGGAFDQTGAFKHLVGTATIEPALSNGDCLVNPNTYSFIVTGVITISG